MDVCDELVDLSCSVKTVLFVMSDCHVLKQCDSLCFILLFLSHLSYIVKFPLSLKQNGGQ